MPVQISATYRHKGTGLEMLLMDASVTDNFLSLAPDQQRWLGTSQDFATEFEFVKHYEKPENGALSSGGKARNNHE